MDVDDLRSRGDFQQQIPLVRVRERIARGLEHRSHVFDVGAMDQLTRRHLVTGRRAHLVQQFERGRHIRHGADGGGLVDEAREDFQGRRGDHAERAFRADEVLLQVIAGIVFLQPLQAVIDLAVRQHDFQAQHQLARVAELQHVHAARVRGDVAADHAGALGTQRQREEAAGFQRRLLHVLQHHARFDGHGHAVGVDVADFVHPVEREHDIVAVRPWRAAATKPGMPALRDDADAVLVAILHDLCDFLDRRRPRDTDAGAGELGAPVHGVTLGRLRPRGGIKLLDQRFQDFGCAIRHGGFLSYSILQHKITNHRYSARDSGSTPPPDPRTS